jgi:hypothetical protein
VAGAIYFSEQFNISRNDDDDWFDPILNADTKLFVDPFLIFSEDTPFWAPAHDDLIQHFNIVFKLIAEAGGNRESLAFKKAISLLHFPEPREFCLGYTRSGVRGAGGALGYALLIAEAMESAIRRGVEDLRHFEELGVLNEGIGPDRISDLTCNVLRSYFIKYTTTIVERHNINTQAVRVGGAYFDDVRQSWRSQDVQLPVDPETGSWVLLAPSRFLRDLPVLNPDDWWDNFEAEQLRNDLNYEVMGRVSKEEIMAAARQHPESVRAWTEAKEGTSQAPYSFERDPLGLWKWLDEAKKFVSESPLVISPPTDASDFVATIELIVEKFKHFIEEQGGWRLLWNDGYANEKPEEAAQLLFKGVAQSYCQANDIVVDREVELGRGPVDFKFSNGYSHRAHLEIKKLHNGKFWNGLQEQLPSYLRSDECDLGWFVAIRYRESGSTLNWLSEAPRIVRAKARETGIQLRTASIDARPKLSGSRL